MVTWFLPRTPCAADADGLRGSRAFYCAKYYYLFFCLTPTIAVERPGILVFLRFAYKWQRPEFSKIHIFETKANLHRKRDTCLMDLTKLLFYHGPIAICILELRPPPSQCRKYCPKLDYDILKDTTQKNLILHVFHITLMNFQRRMF